MSVSQKIQKYTMYTRFSKNPETFALRSGSQNCDFSSTFKKDLKLGQCLNVDEMTPPSTFGEGACPLKPII